jgi:hypothetical protein
VLSLFSRDRRKGEKRVVEKWHPKEQAVNLIKIVTNQRIDGFHHLLNGRSEVPKFTHTVH